MRKNILYGLLASLFLITFYFAVMFLFTRSLPAAISQIKELWPWFSLLVVGFGIQFGLFYYLRAQTTPRTVKVPPGTVARTRDSSQVERGMISVNTGMSGISMVACCAHHLTDVLPFLGLAGISLFLTRYQVWFISIGLESRREASIPSRI